MTRFSNVWQLSCSIPDGAFLCIVDVVGLYPRIPHGEDLGAMRGALDGRVNPTVATETQVGLASLVLNKNYCNLTV